MWRTDLVVQRQILDAVIDVLAALGTETDDAQTRLVDLLSELVDCHIRRRADQRLALALRQEDNGGGTTGGRATGGRTTG